MKYEHCFYVKDHMWIIVVTIFAILIAETYSPLIVSSVCANASENLSMEDLVSAARKVDFEPPKLTVTTEGREMISKQRKEGRSAFSELRKKGDSVIDPLLLVLQEEEAKGILSSNFRRECLDLLKGGNSEKFLKARKEVCLPLLKSKVIDDNWLGLQGVRGMELDEELLTWVLSHLNRTKVLDEALYVVRDDLSGKFLDRKIQAITDALFVSNRWKNADRRQDKSSSAFGNPADIHYVLSIRVLCSLKGENVNKEIEESIGFLQDGVQKDCLIVALANRGMFRNQRSALVALLQNQRNRTFPHLRLEAVKAFELSGEKEDLPFLQELAGSDPYCYEDYQGLPRHERWKDEYINLTVDQIEHPDGYFLPKQVVLKGTPTPQKTTYPIREAAKKAIEAIEAREAGKEEKQ